MMQRMSGGDGGVSPAVKKKRAARVFFQPREIRIKYLHAA
jgi:hypothetical protein